MHYIILSFLPFLPLEILFNLFACEILHLAGVYFPFIELSWSPKN
jgi:hypothetical protein